MYRSAEKTTEKEEGKSTSIENTSFSEKFMAIDQVGRHFFVHRNHKHDVYNPVNVVFQIF